jgi:hypothetical protein
MGELVYFLELVRLPSINPYLYICRFYCDQKISSVTFKALT